MARSTYRSAISFFLCSSASYSAFAAVTGAASGESIATHVPGSSNSQNVPVSASSITTCSSSCSSVSGAASSSAAASSAPAAGGAAADSAAVPAVSSASGPERPLPPPLPVLLTPSASCSSCDDCSLPGSPGSGTAPPGSRLFGVTSLPKSSWTRTAVLTSSGTAWRPARDAAIFDAAGFLLPLPPLTLCPGARETYRDFFGGPVGIDRVFGPEFSAPDMETDSIVALCSCAALRSGKSTSATVSLSRVSRKRPRLRSARVESKIFSRVLVVKGGY